MRQFAIMTTMLSLYALNKTAEKQNKKLGLKLDGEYGDVCVEDEEEYEEYEEDFLCGTDDMGFVFDFLAQGSDAISDSQLLAFGTELAQCPNSGFPLWQVPITVEFVGFFVPDQKQCTMNWDMVYADFENMVCMLEGFSDMDPDVEPAFWFSFVDFENNCSINQYEASFVLDYFGVDPDTTKMVLDFLGAFAGDDEELSFDEWKAAIAALMGGPEKNKKQIKNALFKGRKQVQIKRMLKKSLKFSKKQAMRLRK